MSRIVVAILSLFIIIGCTSTKPSNLAEEKSQEVSKNETMVKEELGKVSEKGEAQTGELNPVGEEKSSEDMSDMKSEDSMEDMNALNVGEDSSGSTFDDSASFQSTAEETDDIFGGFGSEDASTSAGNEETASTGEDTMWETMPGSSSEGSVAQKDEVILVVSTNNLVEEADNKAFTKAIIDKWLKDKKYKEVDLTTYQNTMENFEGNTVLIAKIIRAYGEFEITVRAGVVTQDDLGPYEEQIGKWNARGAQTSDDVVREIKYGKDVFQK